MNKRDEQCNLARERMNELIKDKADLTKKEIAKQIGIQKSSLSQYLNGQNIPGEVNAKKMAEYFNVNYKWLQGDSDASKDDEIIDIINSRLSQLTIVQRQLILDVINNIIASDH